MSTKTKVRKLTGSKAMAEAIDIAMQDDKEVFVMGEDVAKYGGIFGSTTGLHEKYGDERIMDTPISETGFIGAAVGAAGEGMRPIVELMFVDFVGVVLDQIYNHIAKIPYMSGQAVKMPITLITEQELNGRLWILRGLLKIIRHQLTSTPKIPLSFMREVLLRH